MSTLNDGGPAFPAIGSEAFPSDPQGMSIRDWFAGQYLNGIAAGSVIESTATRIGNMADLRGVSTAYFIASMAYEAADAMIAKRDQMEAGK